MDQLFNIPFLNTLESDKIKLLSKDLKAYKSELKKLKTQIEQVVDEEKRASILKDIEEYENNIKNLEAKIRSLIEEVAVRIEAHVDKRLDEILNNNNESKFLVGLSDGKTILRKDVSEYELLIKLKEVLERAKDSYDICFKNLMFINKKDKEEMNNLYLKYEKIKDNYEGLNGILVFKLEEYLRSLESKFVEAEYQAEVKEKTLRDTLVLKSDVKEYNLICEIIKLLRDKDLGMIEVWEVAFLKEENILKFKTLASSTEYFKKYIPVIPQNEKIIEEIKSRLKEMFIKAKNSGEKLNENGIGLSDEKEYELLNKRYQILEKSRYSSDLEEMTDGALIGNEYKEEYDSIIKSINSLRKIDEPKYEDTLVKIDEKLKKVTSIRKPKKETLEFINNNKTKIIGVGLAIGVTLIGIPALASSLIYLNCLAGFKDSEFVPICNTINEFLASICGAKRVPMDYAPNFPVMYQNAKGVMYTIDTSINTVLQEILFCLAKLGIITGLGYTSVHLIKGVRDVPKKEKTSVLTKLKDIASSLKSSLKSRKENSKDDELFKEIEENVNLAISDSDKTNREKIEQKIEDRASNIEEEISPYLEDDGKIKVEIPTDEEIMKEISDENVVLAVLDNYHDALMNNETELAMKYRNVILKYTGLDVLEINPYDNIFWKDFILKIKHSMTLKPDILIERFEAKAMVLQKKLDDGTLTVKEVRQANLDLDLINNRIEELRGMKREM